ncbi:MAG: hypothetical protein ABIG70_13315 [Pseudomonadota bacterium]
MRNRRVFPQHVRVDHHHVVQPVFARRVFDDGHRVQQVLHVALIFAADKARLRLAAIQGAGLEVHGGVVEGRRGSIADASLGHVQEAFDLAA